MTAKLEIKLGDGEVNALFLLDTKTGKVWRYQGMAIAKKDQKEQVLDEMFLPIGFAEYTPQGKTSPTH